MPDAKNDWVRSVLGFDPSSHEAPAAGAAAASASAPAGTGAIDAERATFAAKLGAAKPALDKARTRAVLPTGEAADAQNRLATEIADMTAAFQAKDWGKATQQLTAAVADAKIVLAAPDPAMVKPQPGTKAGDVLYGTEAGDTRDVSETDVHQNALGDCYLMSSLGEIARIKPALIKQMIKENGDGTYTVTLHREKTGLGYLYGKLTGQEFDDVQVVVDGNFGTGSANSGSGQDQVPDKSGGSKKEVWVQVVEKAYAKLNGGYDKIDHGGWAAPAMETLTGKRATGRPAASVTAAELEDAIAKGKPVVMDTPSLPNGSAPFGLVGPHAYMLQGIRTDPSGRKFIQLKNPWGFANPSEIPFDQLSGAIQTVEEGAQL